MDEKDERDADWARRAVEALIRACRLKAAAQFEALARELREG